MEIQYQAILSWYISLAMINENFLCWNPPGMEYTIHEWKLWKNNPWRIRDRDYCNLIQNSEEVTDVKLGINFCKSYDIGRKQTSLPKPVK